MILLQKRSGRIMSEPFGANFFDKNTLFSDKNVSAKLKSYITVLSILENLLK